MSVNKLLPGKGISKGDYIEFNCVYVERGNPVSGLVYEVRGNTFFILIDVTITKQGTIYRFADLVQFKFDSVTIKKI